MNTTSTSELIGSFSEHAPPSSCQAGVIDHVGFLGPIGMDVERAMETLRTEGFSFERRSFQSLIVARELAALCALPNVPTTIALGYATTSTGRMFGVEVFLPEAPEEQLREWIAGGIASHVAIALDGREAFFDAREFLERAGFSLPAFRQMEPISMIPKPGGTFMTMYLDRPEARGYTRVELCCNLPA